MAKAILSVTFDTQTKDISVSAPQDLMLAYGMIGFVQAYIFKKIIANFGDDNKILPFKGPLPPLKS